MTSDPSAEPVVLERPPGESVLVGVAEIGDGVSSFGKSLSFTGIVMRAMTTATATPPIPKIAKDRLTRP